jgi:hypothetical protein
MERLERLTRVVECHCREVINEAHPLPVEAVGGQEHLVCEGDCQPDHEGLIIGAPYRQGSDSHGHARMAAVLDCEKPLQVAITRVVLTADEGAMVGEGVPHD